MEILPNSSNFMTPHGLNTHTANDLEKFGFVGVGVSVVRGMQEHVDTIATVKPGCGELLAPTRGRRILEDLRQWICVSRRIGRLRRPHTFCIGGGDNQHDCTSSTIGNFHDRHRRIGSSQLAIADGEAARMGMGCSRRHEETGTTASTTRHT
jgi:hypothetical protein